MGDAPGDEDVELQPEPLLTLLSLQALLLLPALAQHRRAGAGRPRPTGLPAPRLPGRRRQRARRATACRRQQQQVPPLLFQHLIGLLLAGGRVQHRARRARPAAGRGARRGAALTFPDTSSLHTDCFRPERRAAGGSGGAGRGGGVWEGAGVEPGLPWELLRAAPGGGGAGAGLTPPPAPPGQGAGGSGQRARRWPGWASTYPGSARLPCSQPEGQLVAGKALGPRAAARGPGGGCPGCVPPRVPAPPWEKPARRSPAGSDTRGAFRAGRGER